MHLCAYPKNRGNSINRMFGVGWEDHKDLGRYRDELPPELFDNYFKFAVVRNPWDRLLSDYNYQRKKSREKESKLFVFTEQGSKRNFSEWVDLALSDSSRYEARRWGGEVSQAIHRWSPQIDWISVDGKPSVNFVARIENLQEDFSEVCSRVGLPGQRVPHRNRRLHWHYSHYYDRATRDRVSEYYAEDIEYFGYDFEDRIFRLNLGGGASRKVSQGKFRNEHVAVKSTTAIVASTDAAAAPAQSRMSWWQRSSPIAVGCVLLIALAFTVSLAARTALVQKSVQESVGHAFAQSARATDTMSTNPWRALRSVFSAPSKLHFSTSGGLPVALPLMPVIEMDEQRATSFSASRPGRTAATNNQNTPTRHARLREQ